MSRVSRSASAFELYLSVRSFNGLGKVLCLDRMTVADVMALGRAGLEQVPGLGRKSVAEIERELGRHGFELPAESSQKGRYWISRAELHHWRKVVEPPPSPTTRLDALPLWLPARARKTLVCAEHKACEERHYVVTVADALAVGLSWMVSSCVNFRRKSAQALYRFLREKGIPITREGTAAKNAYRCSILPKREEPITRDTHLTRLDVSSIWRAWSEWRTDPISGWPTRDRHMIVQTVGQAMEVGLTFMVEHCEGFDRAAALQLQAVLRKEGWDIDWKGRLSLQDLRRMYPDETRLRAVQPREKEQS
jgi:hypothetical protein